MLEGLLGVIKKWFDKMPKWVQVTTFLAFVVAFLYLLLIPNFLDAELVGQVDEEFGEFEIGDALIQIDAGGRIIRLKTDQNGRFAVPLPNRLPFKSTRLLFYPDDDPTGKRVEVSLPYSCVFRTRTKVKYADGKLTVPGGAGTVAAGLVGAVVGVAPAWAQEPHEAGARRASPTDEVEAEVMAALRRLGRVGPEGTSGRRPGDDLRLSKVELSYIRARLERKFDVELGERIWYRVATGRDAVKAARAEIGRVEEDRRLQEIEALRSEGADLDQLDEDGETALTRAARAKQSRVVEALLGEVDVDRKNSEGKTALMIAAQEGCFDIVGALVEAGADPDEEDPQGNTALRLAVRGGYAPIVGFLATLERSREMAVTERVDRRYRALREP